MTDDSPRGRPLRLDPTAASADPNLPAFLARPAGTPVYHGFPLIEETRTDGWVYGAITEVPDSKDGTEGDAYVEAPDGARAGIAWSVGSYPTRAICRPGPARWGVLGIAFPRPVRSMEDLIFCFRHTVTELSRRAFDHDHGASAIPLAVVSNVAELLSRNRDTRA